MIVFCPQKLHLAFRPAVSIHGMEEAGWCGGLAAGRRDEQMSEYLSPRDGFRTPVLVVMGSSGSWLPLGKPKINVISIESEHFIVSLKSGDSSGESRLIFLNLLSKEVNLSREVSKPQLEGGLGSCVVQSPISRLPACL